MDLLRFADHCATEITLIGVVQSSEEKRIETMMRNKKRNNVRKCASCKFIYLSRLHLRLNSCHFEIIEKVLDESSQSFCRFFTLTSSINYSRVSSIRNIGESRSKSIRNLSNPMEKLRVPNLDDSSFKCNGDASKRPTSRSTFSTLSRRSVIVSAIHFVPVSLPLYV